MRRIALALAFAAAACSKAPGRGEPSPQPVETGATTSPPTRNPAMTPFDQALASFRKAAAARASVPERDLDVTPATLDVAELDGKALRTGDLWSFTAEKQKKLVRGWAGPDGTVVTGKDELGPLMRAARVLEPAASLDADALATRVTWMLGPEYNLRRDADDFLDAETPPDFTPPELDRRPDGATLTFFLEYTPFGGGKADPRAARATVEIASDYTTTATVEVL